MEKDKITFKKLDDKNFGVSVPKGMSATTNDTVEVVKRDGSSTTVTIGKLIEENKYGDKIYEQQKKGK